MNLLSDKELLSKRKTICMQNHRNALVEDTVIWMLKLNSYIMMTIASYKQTKTFITTKSTLTLAFTIITTKREKQENLFFSTLFILVLSIAVDANHSNHSNHSNSSLYPPFAIHISLSFMMIEKRQYCKRIVSVCDA